MSSELLADMRTQCFIAALLGSAIGMQILWWRIKRAAAQMRQGQEHGRCHSEGF